MTSHNGPTEAVGEGLRRLGVRRLSLAIHDCSFPSDDIDDSGRGTPSSSSGERLSRFVRGLGFDTLQLGPQGLTSELNPSPYDGAWFSRDPLSISLQRLAHGDRYGPWLDPRELEAIVASRPPGAERRVPYSHAFRVHNLALRSSYESWRGALDRGAPEARRAQEEMEAFARRSEPWLERDTLFQLLREEYGPVAWRSWQAGERAALDARLFAPRRGEEDACRARRVSLLRERSEAARRYRFVQWMAHEQHHAFRVAARDIGLAVYGDMQIGFSERDEWAWQSLLLPGHRLGAPPSRTNPEGQPWGYPVLAPVLFAGGSKGAAALEFFVLRLEKLFSEYDGVRVDHPHGLVCPWVYRENDPDPLHAVQGGARLFSSPDLLEHPDLTPFAIAERAQLNPDPATPRHADDWVISLRDDQVERYAVLVDAMAERARLHGRVREDLVCEVLSTLPHPLERVLQRHGLGRFRVTQKAAPGNLDDVYCPENARPEDWIMVGNHDTPPIWQLAEVWQREGIALERARDLAGRLEPDAGARGPLAEELAREPARLARAHFADLLASPARQVMVFFTDLFGLKEVYNRPGTTHPENWSLRLPRDFEASYRESACRGAAFVVPEALALALHARGLDRSPDGRALVRRLEGEASRLCAGSAGERS